jgi:hypothetical protein
MRCCCQADDVQWYQVISYRLDQHGVCFSDVVSSSPTCPLTLLNFKTYNRYFQWESYRFVSYNNYQLKNPKWML